MRRLPRETRATILGLLNDGMSIRATERATGANRLTITKLVVDAGHACADEHARRVRGLRCRSIQADEIWAYCAMKAKRVPQGAPRRVRDRGRVHLHGD